VPALICTSQRQRRNLQGDPLGPVLEAFEASLGAMGALWEHAEASRQPMGAKERAEMTRQLVQACRADVVRQAVSQSRRLAVLSGLGAAALLLACNRRRLSVGTLGRGG
jgi:hypothetical protein